MEKLTTKQKLILQITKKLIAEKGYPPTVREIGKAINVSSPATVQAHLNHLANKGYIRKENIKNRTIELLVENEYVDRNELVVDVPLLGKVTAGSPIEAIETPNEFFSLPAYLIPKNKEVFTLHVSGESMINAGILDDDIVILERRNDARNGDIVVAMIDENEVTQNVTQILKEGLFN